MIRYFALIVILAAAGLGQIPAVVTAEPDLEKRSELALKEADLKLTEVTKEYLENPDSSAFTEGIQTVGELAKLSLKSLQDTGKRASRSPKYFKRAEMRLRGLLRRLDSFSKEVSSTDREQVDKVKTVVSETHEQVLHDIMSKR